MANNKKKIVSLPNFGGTGSGLSLPQEETIGGNGTPTYKGNSFLEFLKNYGVIISIVFASFGFFLYQIWTPLVELKSKVSTLEKDVGKHDTLIEKSREDINNLYRQTVKQENQPTQDVTKVSDK